MNKSAQQECSFCDQSNKPSRQLLYNPIPALLWSFLFSPIFGACIIYSNWKTLQNSQAAKRSLYWLLGLCCLYFSPIILIFSCAEAFEPLGWRIQVPALVAWFFFECRPQLKEIKNIPDFVRKKWRKPLLSAVSIWLGLAVLVRGFAALTAPPPPILNNTSADSYDFSSKEIIRYLERNKIAPLIEKGRNEIFLPPEDKEEIKAFNTLKYLLIYGDRQELIGKDANQLLEHAKKRIQAANNRELIMKSFQQ